MNDERTQTEQGDTRMESRVKELAFLEETRKSIETGMNNDDQVISLKALMADLKCQLEDTEAALATEQCDAVREIEQIDREISETKSYILAAWDGNKRTIRFGDKLLKMRTTKSVDIKDGGKLLTALTDIFTAKRIAAEFISTYNKKNIRAFLKLHPQEPDVVRLTKDTKVYLDLNA